MKPLNLQHIQSRILIIRGHKVMIDMDLAALYNVSTKRLNEQVKRNSERFPQDLMFQLTRFEKEEVVAKCDHLANLKYSAGCPYVFTEHGALMLASVLHSKRAVQMSLYIVRAFIRLRELLATHKELLRKLKALENRYDSQFKVVFETIRELMEKDDRKISRPPAPVPKVRGFTARATPALQG